MSEKKYWKSFGELNLTESYMKDQENEFREDLPGVSDDGKGMMDAKHPRRDFLKFLDSVRQPLRWRRAAKCL